MLSTCARLIVNSNINVNVGEAINFVFKAVNAVLYIYVGGSSL